MGAQRDRALRDSTIYVSLAIFVETNIDEASKKKPAVGGMMISHHDDDDALSLSPLSLSLLFPSL